MENTRKNVACGSTRPNTHKPPMKSVSPRVTNQFTRSNCGSTPVRKIHDCLGGTLSRGDTLHNCLQKKADVREELPINSERSSILSISTMTTMNNGKQLNMMATCDPIHGIKFVVREFKQRLKAIYPDDEIFYQMISEIGRLVKRVEYGDLMSVTVSQDGTKPKRFVEKCTECENLSTVARQMDEDLACEKERNKILSAQIVDLESQIVVKQSNIAQVEQELCQVKEQFKNLQAVVAEKKLYDDSLLNKLDECNKKLQQVTQDLFMSKLENERVMTQLKMNVQLNESLQKDLDRIYEINNDIESRKTVEESMVDVAIKSSPDLNYKADESCLGSKMMNASLDDQ